MSRRKRDLARHGGLRAEKFVLILDDHEAVDRAARELSIEAFRYAETPGRDDIDLRRRALAYADAVLNAAPSPDELESALHKAAEQRRALARKDGK